MDSFLVMGDFTTEGRGRKAVVENTGIESSILQQIKESDFTIYKS